MCLSTFGCWICGKRFPHISTSLKMKEFYSFETSEYDMTAAISQKNGVLNNTTVKNLYTHTLVKVRCDLYESLRGNVLQKSGLSYGSERKHGIVRSFFLIVCMS